MTETQPISRRDFLKGLVTGAGAAILTACGIKPAESVDPTLSPTLTKTPESTFTPTATSIPTETPTPTEIPLPPAPEWASDYLQFHQGKLETIDGQDYYTSHKQINVDGETREVNLKLIEYDSAAHEWIPSYQTVQELLDKKEFGSLNVLNYAPSPEQAHWMIRQGGEAETSDLRRLEKMFTAFAAKLESEYPPTISNFSNTLPRAKITDYTHEHILETPPPTELAKIDITSWNYKGINPYGITPLIIDGVDILNPRSWVTLRRGKLDQIVAGVLSDLPGILWLGFDKSVTDETCKQYPKLTFIDAMNALSPAANHIWWYGLIFIKDYDANFGKNYTSEQLAAWSDIRDYYAALPSTERSYVQQAIDLFSLGQKENVIQNLSGKIVWRITGAFNKSD